MKLAALLQGSPHDLDARLVHADALLAAGDPRGQLAHLQHALGGELDDARRGELEAEVREQLDRHGAALLGPLHGLDGVAELTSLRWRLGYLEHARLDRALDQAGVATALPLRSLLEALLRSPASALLESLELGLADERAPAEPDGGDGAMEGEPSCDFAPLVAALLEAADSGAPLCRSLRSLRIGDFVFPDAAPLELACLGAVGALSAQLPRLEHLGVLGGDLELASLSLAGLRSLELRLAVLGTGALDALAAALDATPAAALERLELWVGDDRADPGPRLRQLCELLDPARLPALRHLALRLAPDGDALAALLVATPLAAQLEQLDLRAGTLGDAGAATLAAALEPGGALARLSLLDVHDNDLGASAVAALERLGRRDLRVRLGLQRDTRDADEDPSRRSPRHRLAVPRDHRVISALDTGRRLANTERRRRAADVLEALLELSPPLAPRRERQARRVLARCLREVGDVRAARDQLELLLAAQLGDEAPAARSLAATRLSLALVLDDLGEHDAAQQQLAAAHALAESDPSAREALLPSVLGAMAKQLLVRGRPRQAIERFEQVRALHEASGADLYVAECDERIAAALQMQGDYAAALERYERAIGGYRAADERRQVAKALGNLATVYWSLGRWPDAERCYREALEASRAVGDLRNQATVLANLAQGSNSRGLLEDAERYGAEALDLFRQLAHPAGVARVLHYLADTAIMRGDLALAASRLEPALAAYREAGDERSEAQALDTLGALSLDRGDIAAATDAYASAIALYQRCDDPYGEGMGRVGRANAALATADGGAEARAQLERALALFERIGNQRGMLLARTYAGLERLLAGEPAAAAAAIGDALRDVSGDDSPHQRARAESWLAVALARSGDLRSGRAALGRSAAGLGVIDDAQGGEQHAVASALVALCEDPDAAAVQTAARTARRADYVALEARLLAALLPS